MGLFSDTVPRELYDRECQRADAAEARVDALINDILRLKRKGHELPHEAKPGRVIQAGPTADELAAHRIHDTIVENLAKDVENMTGIDASIARREAERLRSLITGASMTDPPV